MRKIASEVVSILYTIIFDEVPCLTEDYISSKTFNLDLV